MSQESRFCHRCGAPLSPGSAFCARCGTPVSGTAAPPGPTMAPSATPSAPSTWERRYEKQEKHEKREKREKNEKQEKGRGGDLAGAITGGLVLILLGTLFYLAQTGTISITWSNWWEYFIIGMGVILIITGFVRYAQRGYTPTGSLIGGAVLILLGFAFVSSNNFSIWPLVLVVIGVAAIASAFSGRRRNPAP